MPNSKPPLRTEGESTYETLRKIADEYGASTTRDKLCVKDHPLDGVAAMCLPSGANSLLDTLEEHGLRVDEIPERRPDCHRAGHAYRVYICPIDLEGSA